MKKTLLLSLTLCATMLSFGQYSQDFETTTWDSTVRGGDAAQAVGLTTTNPVKDGLNTTENAFQITLTDTAPSWRWAFVANPGGTYDATNGTWYKFKFLSENETDVTIALEPWFAGVRHATNEVVFTGLDLNTWYEVEFNFADAIAEGSTTAVGDTPGFLSRIDIKINATGTYDGDVFYIDEIEQNTAATLATKTFEKNKLSAFYNNSKQAILFNDVDASGSYKVYDLTGRVLLKGQISKEVNVSSLRTGLYILATENGSLKFVK